ncbi:DUF6356 family protein [Arenicella chitinivorans]|uniref:DUF6356 family protein n=1 Tax=Arenicella chitinivorans TaxID=1329800 RepID=UPI00357177A4
MRLFSEHPASVGETYWTHLLTALRFSGVLFVAGVCCFVHALFPFLFPKTASLLIYRLHTQMIVQRTLRQNKTGRDCLVD